MIRIFVPDDSAAVSVGADQVAAGLAEALTDRAEIRRNGSRGAFWLEPLVEVETAEGRVAYGPVTPADVASLAAAGLETGAAHPLRLGPVDQIEWLATQQRLTFARAGVIEPLSLSDYEATDGLKGLRRALELSPEEICKEILDSGLRGRGGAGFPAGIKWRTVLDQPGEKHVACNADEGDSATFADRLLMEADPFHLLEGLAIAARATGAEFGWLYIRSEYPEAIGKMTAAIQVLEQAGWIGPQGRVPVTIRVRRGAGSYICGEESAMLNSIEGKRGTVRSKPPIPAIEGLHGRPTLVNNVLTLAAAPTVLAEGAAYYRDFGMGRSTGTKPFQIGGNVARGGLVELAFGVTIRELVEGYGGGTASGRPLRAVQLGGPLGAYVSAQMLDLPMDYEALAEAGAMLGHGGLCVFDDAVDMAEMARFAFEFCAVESCGKCTPCRVGAVRGRETMEKILAGTDVAGNVALVEDLCELMRDGSLCAMGGLTPMPVLSALRLFPQDFDRAPSHAPQAAE